MQVSGKILHDQEPTYIYKRRLGMTVVETCNSARHFMTLRELNGTLHQSKKIFFVLIRTHHFCYRKKGDPSRLSALSANEFFTLFLKYKGKYYPGTKYSWYVVQYQVCLFCYSI